MPAGGATVTGGVQRNAQTYRVRLFMDGNEITQFREFSFYTKGDTKNANGDLIRYEFQTSGTPVAPAAFAGQPVATTVGEYITLSYDGGSTMSKSRYEVWTDAAEPVMLPEETNQAQKSNCFQMPAQNVVIYAYFSTKAIHIRSLKVNGIGSVGIIDQNGVSVDSIPAGESFVLSLTPGEGYFFNTNPADGKIRLHVTRHDNGGDILPVAVDTSNPREILYSFASMPKDGIDVNVTFDKVAYVLQLSAIDEANNPLTGNGYWKLIINKKEYPVDNNTSTVSAEYGDTVSVSLTSAGASEFKFVKYILNNNITMDSTSKSFTITGDLSRVPNQIIPVTIVLRPMEHADSGNPFPLTATSNGKGNASFFVIRSDAHPGTVDLVNYATRAYAHSIVAILPKAVTPAEYTVDAAKIRVNLKEGGFITPTADTTSIAGKTVYTFEMPSNGYKDIYVPFVPRAYNVTAATNPANAALGLFKIVYKDGSSNDVLLDDTFKSAPFGTVVNVVLTEAGAAHNVHIDADASLATVAVADENKGKTSNGFWFKMPAKDIAFTVFLRDKDDGIAGVPKAVAEPPVPTPKKTTLPGATSGGTKVAYYSDAAMTNALTSLGGTLEVTEGDVVYVKIDPTADLGGKEIKSFDYTDGTNPVSSAGPDGKLTVKGTETTLTIKTEVKKFTLKVAVANAPADLTSITVNGTPVPVGGTFSPVTYGDTVTIKADSASAITSVDGFGTTAPTISGGNTATGKFEPDAEDGATVTVTINYKKTYKMMVNLVDAEPTDSVTVEGTVISASGTMVAYDHFVDTDTVNFTNATRDIKSVEGLNSYTPTDAKNGTGMMQAYETDTVTVTVTFEKAKYNVVGTDTDGKTVTYLKPDDTVLSGTQVEKGYTLKVKGDPGDDAHYVKSIKITDVNDEVTTIEDGGSYVVNASIKTVEVERAFKLVKVKFTVTVPSGADYKISVDSGDGFKEVGNPATGLKDGDVIKLEAAYSTIKTYSESTGQIDSLHKLSEDVIVGTVKPKAATKNGDTITIPVELEVP